MNTVSKLVNGKIIDIDRLIMGILLLVGATIIGCFTVPHDVETLSSGMLISATIALIGAGVIMDSLFKAVVFLFLFSLFETSFVISPSIIFDSGIFAPGVVQIYFQALIANCIFGCLIGGLLFMFVSAKQAVDAMSPRIKTFMQQRKKAA